MEKTSTFILLICTILLTGCRSKEEKAAELIKKELSKSLYDFDSYQPIETIVNEAKASIYNDSVCWAKGSTLAYGIKQAMEYAEQYESAKEHMEIWGRPTYYSSTYSDNQYYKYKKEYEDALEEFIATGNACKILAESLKETAEKIDTTMVIGWEVSHRFRCKTKGGNSAIGDYRYIISKDFKSVLICEDVDNDKEIREALESIQSDYWDNIDFIN